MYKYLSLLSLWWKSNMAQNQHGVYIKHVKEHWESEKEIVNEEPTHNGNIFAIVKTCIIKSQQYWAADWRYIWKPKYVRTKLWTAVMITKNILVVVINNQQKMHSYYSTVALRTSVFCEFLYLDV